MRNNNENEIIIQNKRFGFECELTKKKHINISIHIFYVTIHHAVQALNSEWIIMRLLLYFCGSSRQTIYTNTAATRTEKKAQAPNMPIHTTSHSCTIYTHFDITSTYIHTRAPHNSWTHTQKRWSHREYTRVASNTKYGVYIYAHAQSPRSIYYNDVLVCADAYLCRKLCECTMKWD